MLISVFPFCVEFIRNSKIKPSFRLAEKAVIEVTAPRLSLSSTQHGRTYPKSGHPGKRDGSKLGTNRNSLPYGHEPLVNGPMAQKSRTYSANNFALSICWACIASAGNSEMTRE